MWPKFGIKCGNSTLCIAHVKSDGKAEVIANKQGDRVSQAVLLWAGKNEIECGLTAKQKMSTRPKQAVANSFQLLMPDEELNCEKIDEAIKQIPCEFDTKTKEFQLKLINNSDSDNDNEQLYTISAYDVQVQLFNAELELARQYYNNGDEKPTVVLSIPSYYPLTAWSSLSNAAEEAGFHVAQIVSESTAAVLAYGIGEEEAIANQTKYILTIKSGGLFSHFTLYAVRYGLYSQLDVYGPFAIGGRQYTEALVQFICTEFQRKYKLDPHESRRSLAKIRTAAANCKHILSTLPSTQLYIDSLMDGVDFNMQMTRARFESFIQPVIGNFMQALSSSVERALQEHTEVKRIDEIILLGATMQIPKLQAAVAARFPDAKIHTSIPTDEVVAVGCARQATFLIDSNETELKLTKSCVITEDELLIWHGDNESNAQVLLDKGTILPKKIRLNVQACENTENKELFRLRNGDEIKEISLKDATPTDDNVFVIEAELSCETNDPSKPSIQLRCL